MTARLWACTRCRYVLATRDLYPGVIPSFRCEVCRLGGVEWNQWEAVRLIDIVDMPVRR